MRSWKDFREKLHLDDNKNFIGYKSSTQSLMLGEKCILSVVSIPVIFGYNLIKKH